MANYCDNTIKIYCTENELNEIENIIFKEIVELPATYDGWEFWDNQLSGNTRWGFDYKCLLPLSKMFPGVLFHLTNEIEGYPEDGDDIAIIDGGENYDVNSLYEFGYDYETGTTNKIISDIKQTSQRYINNSYDNSYGRLHKISLENGKLSAIGDNSLAQCDVLKWKNVVQISTGEYHTVGLLENGTLVATGSNTNLQCEIDKIDSVKSISCGRYHTAILLNNGTVKILGKLSTLSDFAKIMENLYSDSMYDEDIVDGDKINAFLSALVNVDSDVSTWKNIKTIKSIYDGVISIDNDNKLYICGNIGCNDKALMDFVKDY